MYYEQGLSSILWPSQIESISPYFVTIAGLFNLEIDIVLSDDDSNSLMCFFVGWTAKEKILASLIPSGIAICLLFIMFAIIKAGQLIRCQLYCESFNCCKARRHAHTFKCCNTNFGKAFITLFVVCVGQMLSVAFKIVNYSVISDVQTVH